VQALKAHSLKHRCTSKQNFGDAKDFSQISPNVPEKNSKENDLKKTKITAAIHFILGAIFQIKALQAPFLS